MLAPLARVSLLAIATGCLSGADSATAEVFPIWPRDPQIHHTNGMRIASSEPLRASCVMWTVNPDQYGYGGYGYNNHFKTREYRCAVRRAEAVDFIARCPQCQQQAWGSYYEIAPALAGLETNASVELGEIPAMQLQPRGEGSRGAAAQDLPATGGLPLTLPSFPFGG